MEAFRLVDMVYSKACLPDSASVSAVADYFKQTTSTYAALSHDGKLVGLIGNEQLQNSIGTQFGWSVFANRKISELMNHFPIIFDGKESAIDLLQLVVARPIETVYEDVIIAENGYFVGLVSVKNLMILQLHHLNEQLETMETQQSLLQKTIATYLLDQNMSPNELADKMNRVVATAQELEVLEKKSLAQTNDTTCRVKLQGYIEAFSVIDLLQLLVQGGKSGRLSIDVDSSEGLVEYNIFVDRGQLVHAEGADAIGKVALWQCLLYTNGEFIFVYDEKSTTTTINDNAMHLLIEGCRQQDEDLARANITQC